MSELFRLQGSVMQSGWNPSGNPSGFLATVNTSYAVNKLHPPAMDSVVGKRRMPTGAAGSYHSL